MEKLTLEQIPEYENYHIDTIGNIYSKKRFGSSGGIVKQFSDKQGYLRVGLTKNNVRKQFGVHRLVALTFIPNPENKPTVNHKNGIKYDNNVENLEWATVGENTQHAYDKGLLKPAMKGKKGALNKRSSKIEQYTLSGYLINTFESMRECAKQTGISMTSLSYCCSGKTKQAGGFNFKKL